MFIRTTRVRRGQRVYEYPQLVESYRPKGGSPAHRVVASLKDWPPETVRALDLALRAAREGKILVPAIPTDGVPAEAIEVLQNLTYLPIGAYIDMWDRWALTDILDDLLPSSSICTHGQILQTLVLHRCIDPGSKLSACTWYPSTALPELLGIKARYVNNSRVHRALDALCEAENTLQARLAARVGSADGGVLATYLDLTDTWFVGRGPELARKGKTKEGLYREKVGIALLCDQRGYPLMWQTVEGGRYEPSVMFDLLERAVDDEIITCQPVVMDRAMGRGVHLAELSDAGIPFVTMLTRLEYASFVEGGPWEQFGGIELSCSPRVRKVEVERLGTLAVEAGMTPASNGRFVLDVGTAACKRADPVSAPIGQDPIAELLREVEFMEQAFATGAASTMKDLAGWYDVEVRTIGRYLRLRPLCPEVRARVLQGEAVRVELRELTDIAGLPPQEQEPRFDVLLQDIADRATRTGKPPTILEHRRRHLLLRRVVWFSPELLLRRQRTAREQLSRLQASVQALNEAQRGQATPRPAVVMLADARSLLERLHWLNMFEVTTKARRMHGRQHHELVLTRNDDEWKRRRRLDGFGVVVAAPTVRRTARDLVDLYFSKDIIEKDFRVIKSEIDLRPVHHRTDPKVRAHVSLCVLALLLQRTLEQRLSAGGEAMTAARATSTLRTCHLNRLAPQGAEPHYTVTRPTPEQSQLLTHLGLLHLVDDAHVKGSLTPR